MKNRPDPSAPFERKPELMQVYNTGECRYKSVGTSLKLQQRWRWDDGSCAGWRDVPIVYEESV